MSLKNKTDRRQTLSNSIFAYSMFFPSLFVLFAIIAYPVLFSVLISFTDLSMRKGFSGYTYIGFSNFTRIFRDPEIGRVVFQSCWWTFCVFGFSFAAGMILALFLQPLGKLGGKFLTIWLIPWVIPDVVAAVMWSFLLHPSFGAFNYLLMRLQILKTPLAWLSIPYYAMWGVIIAATWRAFPFYLTMMYAALQTLPDELRDASKIDGASSWAFFWYIQIPWIKPVLRIAALLGFIWTFNWFSLVYGMTKGGPGLSTMIIPVYVFKRAMYYFDFARAAAFSVLTLGFLFILIALYVRSMSISEIH